MSHPETERCLHIQREFFYEIHPSFRLLSLCSRSRCTQRQHFLEVTNFRSQDLISNVATQQCNPIDTYQSEHYCASKLQTLHTEFRSDARCGEGRPQSTLETGF